MADADATIAAVTDYWLVWKGTGAKVVKASSKPSGYTGAIKIGPTTGSVTTIQDELATAASKLPSAVNVNGITIPGIAKVQPVTSPLGAALGAAGSVANTVGSAAGDVASVGSFLGKLTEPATWLRILEAIGGLLLLFMGLRQLASVGSGSSAIKGVPVPAVLPV